jgi:hypothetical protein
MFMLDKHAVVFQDGQAASMKRPAQLRKHSSGADHKEHWRFHMAIHEATIHPFLAQGRTAMMTRRLKKSLGEL